MAILKTPKMLFIPDLVAGLRLALRARYLFLSSAAFLILVLVVMLAAMFSGRQPATVALDVGLSVMRLLLPIVMVLITQELLSREFERRYFLNSLTYPRLRLSLFFGRFLAITILVFSLLSVMALALGVMVWWVGLGYAQASPVALGLHYLAVIGFMGFDLLLLTAVASLLAIISSTPSFVLIGTLGFMLVARSYAAIIALLTREAWVVNDAENYRTGLSALGYLLPDLGALDVRMVALYGQMNFMPVQWPWLLLAIIVYTFGLFAVAVWALQRKRFV